MTPTSPTQDSDLESVSDLIQFTPSSLNLYNDTLPPSPTELKQASQHFTLHPPQILWSTPLFRDFPSTPYPEVAFLGRSNVGKSSLLNALFNRPNAKPAHVSKRPGRTRTMNAFGISPVSRSDLTASSSVLKSRSSGNSNNKDNNTVKTVNTSPPDTEKWKTLMGSSPSGIIVVDMPGYGAASRSEWGVEILKYLTDRKQLRRTFMLIDAEHGLKSSDRELLRLLSDRAVVHQIVLSKVDKILYPAAKMPGVQGLSRRLGRLRDVCISIRTELRSEDGRRRPGLLDDVLCCSAEKELDMAGPYRNVRGRIGIDTLRHAVYVACSVGERGPRNEVTTTEN